jgi:oligopeptide/dipeptide ABC transporter ATP-binding protein
LTIGQGELIGLLGESGAGKSASIRALLGLATAHQAIGAAELKLAGIDSPFPTTRAAGKLPNAGVGYLPQQPAQALHPGLSVGRQLVEVLKTRHRRLSRAAARSQALELLARVAVEQPERVLDAGPEALDPATATRVAIAITLARAPRLLIADEPTGALDASAAHRILDLLAALALETGQTLVLATNDPRIAAQYCRRVLVIQAGRIVETGSVDQVLRTPAHPYTKALIDAVAGPGAPAWVLRGRSPAPLAPTPGCPFQTRCDFVHAACAAIAPPLRGLAGGNSVACHLPSGVSAHVAAGL